MASTPNYSLFAIPAYLLLALMPHIYSSTLLVTTTATKSGSKTSPSPGGAPKSNLYNLANPRSSNNSNHYASAIPKHVYARFERARAAHSNMLENSAFVVSAIMAGIFTRLDAAYMNKMAGLYLVTRVLYIVSYISVSRGPLATLRTLWWALGLVVLGNLWWEAGKKIMDGRF